MRSANALASLNRRAENVVVEAVIVAELELRDIQVKVLFADVVEGANNPALEDAPEAFNRIRMDCTDNVLVLGVVNGLVGESLFEVAVAGPLVGAEQANLVRNGFVY